MIRIAVSAEDDSGLDSVVSPHFGRCPYFVLIDVEDRDVSAVNAVQNPFYGHHQPGQVPAFIHEQKADVMLSGGMGSRAIQFFQNFGIRAATGASGTVRMSLERYLGGELVGAVACATSETHHHDDGEYERDEIGRLREEAEMLNQQLDDVEARIRRLGDPSDR
jgi:predicted Fe-Mo cluster-binding NifX family protein